MVVNTIGHCSHSGSVGGMAVLTGVGVGRVRLEVVCRVARKSSMRYS